MIVRLKAARPASIACRLSLAHDSARKLIAGKQSSGVVARLLNRVRPLSTRYGGIGVRSQAEPGTAEFESGVDNGTYALDPSLDFDWRLALNLAGCAFEAYNGLEQEKDEGTDEVQTTIRATAVSGTEITFVDSSFLLQKMAGMLEIQVVGASGLKVSDWWPWSTADPYCRVSLDGWSARTPTVQNSLDPNWNSTLHLFVADTNPKKRLMLRVLDEDSSGSDDFMGAGAVGLGSFFSQQKATEEQAHSSTDQHITVPLTGGTGEVTMKLKFKPFQQLSTNVAATTTKMDDTVLDEVASNRMGDPVIGAPAAAFLASPWRQLKRSLFKDSVDMAGAVQLDPVVYIDNPLSETQAWLFWNPQAKTVVVSFRGTEQDQLKDILTDLSLIPADLEDVLGPQTAGTAGVVKDGSAGEEGKHGDVANKEKKEPIWVHAGFLAAYRSVRAEILQLLDIMLKEGQGLDVCDGVVDSTHDKGWVIYLTGHSLGGALSTLCSYDLASRSESGWRRRQALPPSSIVNYTYGSPRVGNRAFAMAFNDLVPNCWRVVNNNDAVTSVPRLLGYSHVGHCVTVTPEGKLSKVLHSIQKVGEGTDVSDVAAAAIDALMMGAGQDDLKNGTPPPLRRGSSSQKSFLSKLSAAKSQASELASAEDVSALMEAEIEAMKSLMDGTAVAEHLVRSISG
jgi:hypothetical protein